MTWFWLFGFFAVQLGIGFWASRRVTDEADYFVAGRRLGLPLVTMSLFATWFGAETCMGAAGAVYSDGLSGARADPFGYAMCLVLMGVFFAKRLASGSYLTLGDVFRTHFGPHCERLAVLILVPSSLIWGAAQIRALAQVFSLVGGLELDAALLGATILVVAYTFVGGLLGDVITDLVQGGILALGLILLAWMVMMEPPTREAIDLALQAERLSMLPAGESVWVQLDRWSIPIFGSLIAQELVARILAARSPSVAKRGALLSAAIYVLVGSIPIALGLFGPALAPDLTEPEQLLPHLAQKHLPHTLYMLFATALMAAILSTIDSILLSSSALISHNLLVPLAKQPSERTKLWLGRCVVVASGVFAYGVARYASTIYDLVETASALGTAGILVISSVALSPLPKSRTAAIVALLVGLGTTPLAEHVFALPAPFLCSVAAASASYGTVGLMVRWRR